MRIFRKLQFLIAAISIVGALTSCKNSLQPEITNEPLTDEAYIVFNFSNRFTNSDNTPKQGRSIASTFTPALFTNVVFSGSDGNGHTVNKTAESFSALAGQRIIVDVGTWNFTLSADYGSGANVEKYKATKNAVQIQPGPNSVNMKLTADTTNPEGGTYNPADHPGSYLVTVAFPANDVDRLRFEIRDTSNTLIDSAEKSKSIDYSGTGMKTVTFSDDSFTSGVYIISVQFQKINRETSSSTNLYENISTWGEILTINPGVQSTGTITLPETQQVYSITYELGEGGAWDPSYDGSIFVSYTSQGGDYLPGGTRANYITLPPPEAVLRDGYMFDGWFTDAGLSAGPITTFDITTPSDKIFYAKWHEAVFDVYISCDGSDDDYVDDATPYGDGTSAHPFKTITKAYEIFEDLSSTRVDGSPASTVHILSDYPATEPFTGAQGKTGDLKLNIVGAKGGVDRTPVTLTVNLANTMSFMQLLDEQEVDLSYVNIVSTKNLSDTNDYNGYGCFNIENGATLKMTNSSIKYYYAKSAIIGVNGTLYLDNVEITDNVAVRDPAASGDWGCAINVETGYIHIKNRVIIKDNKTYKNDNTDLQIPNNLWIGSYDSVNNSHTLHAIVIDGALTGSEVYVKLDQEINTFTQGYINAGTAEPEAYFKSASGFDIGKNATSGEAEVLPYVYVDATGHDDYRGNGSRNKPYESIEKAVEKITAINNTSLDAKIFITGGVKSNAVLDDGSFGTELKARSLTIEGTGNGSTWQEVAGRAGLLGDTNDDGIGDESILSVSAPTELIIKNLTISYGKTTGSGGALCCDSGKPVTIDSCIFEFNEASGNGGAIYISGSDLTITNAEIKENKVSGTNSDGSGKGCGGAIYISNGELSIDDTVEISSNFSSNFGGAVYLTGSSESATGKLSMNGGIIGGNGAFTQGGGVYIAAYGVLEMSDSTSAIKDNVILRQTSANGLNTNRYGGGVYIAENGTFTMNNGTISNNRALSGAAVFSRGNFTLKQGTITSNARINSGLLTSPEQISSRNIPSLKSTVSSTLGEATDLNKTTSNVELGIPGKFNMEGGTITSDYTKGQNGAGVNIYAQRSHGDETGTAEFNMSGGYIKDLDINGTMGCGAVSLNAVTTSGVTYILKFNMSGGEITGNTSTGLSETTNHAGGVYIGRCGEFYMSGGEISGNSTTLSNGVGGVLIDSTGGTNTISLGKAGQTSTVLINDNTSGPSNAASNLKLNSYDVIAVNGPLSTSSEVGITKAFSTADFTSNFAAKNPGVSPSEIFTSDNGYTITTETNVEGKFAYGTVTVTPGFPGTYSCGYTLIKNGSNRTINIVLKDSTGTVVDPSLINSLVVTLYETGDEVTHWTGTLANNFAEALQFAYPSYLVNDPDNNSFHVEVSIKPSASANVAYSYDFTAKNEE